MSIRSREKMISFRLSAGAYERLRECRVTRGARSISELARAAVSQLIAASRPTLMRCSKCALTSWKASSGCSPSN